MNALRCHLKKIADIFSMHVLFDKIPTIRCMPKEKICCGSPLNVLKTRKRTVVTMGFGTFETHETVYHCKTCYLKYYSEELKELIPYQCHFGFDIIIYVGNALYTKKRSHAEIRQLLKEKDISISLREITYLGNKFITYLTIAHNESKDAIKSHFAHQGGYILHLDGTCEGDSPHLFSSMDELSDIVLHNVKMPTENKKYIIPFLEEIKSSYGKPIAIVSDMSQSILDAVNTVFPRVKHLICHFHFLRDIGKDLFGLAYRNISRFLQGFKISAIIRQCIRELKSLINNDDHLTQCLTDYLSRDNLESPHGDLPGIVSAYLLLTWVIEAKVESNGYGFPFDRPRVDFFRRLQQAYPQLKALNATLKKEKSMALPIRALYNVLNDTALQNNIHDIEEKIIIFDELRAAMRIALVNEQRGLNDEGDVDIKTIASQVKAFLESNIIKQRTQTQIAYKKFVKQINKYWEMLFADPIEVTPSNGEVIEILPQRTNNLMEQSFRSTKHDERKKSGTKSLRKQMRSMHPQRPLVKNLENPDYLKIILNGKASLTDRFADIDAKLVQEEMKKEREVAQKYHKGMSKVFKIPNLPAILNRKSANGALAA